METETRNDHIARQEVDKAKLRVLWGGVCLYALIMVNAFRFAAQVPYQILILGALVNMSIVISLFVAINKVRRRMQGRGQR
jgi:hypothetical protein